MKFLDFFIAILKALLSQSSGLGVDFCSLYSLNHILQILALQSCSLVNLTIKIPRNVRIRVEHKFNRLKPNAKAINFSY